MGVKYKSTLVIVDMQKKFNAATKESTIKNVENLIREFKKNNNPIVLVEYQFYGKSLKRLYDCIGNYKNKFLVLKPADDGSTQISTLIRHLNLPKNLFVCGVNTDCCVLSTVRGLYARDTSYDITVIKNACNSEHDHTYGIRELSKYSKLI